ncbi:hypothetical protein V8E36_000742 [Tilletia maclaganii]
MSRMTYNPASAQPPSLSSSQQQQQSPFRSSASSTSRSTGAGGGGGYGQQQQQYGSFSSSQYPYSQPQQYQSYSSGRGPQQQQQQQRSQQPSAAKQQQHQSLPPAEETWVDTLIYTLDALPPPTTWPSHIIDTLILQPLAFILAIITSPRTHRLILRLSLLTTVFWAALALAIAAYIAFYNAWVPHLGLRVPVWLQYGDPSVAPWADVYFDPPGKFFADDQQYDVTLELTVPLTPANLDLGNFMVSINMYADILQDPVLASSRPTLLHPSASTLTALSSLLSRNPNPDINPFAAISGGAGPGSASGPPITLLSVPLLQRTVLQVGSGSAFSSATKSSPAVTAPKAAAASKGKNGRSASANHIPGHFGVQNPSQNVKRARITVGRSDAERYWMYGGGHGGVAPGRGAGAVGGSDAFVSRGELQTHAVSLRFDAHLTGLRYFMYHYPLFSFLTFTTLFLACELGAAMFAAGVFALYSTIANSNVDVRTPDESFVTSGKSKTSGARVTADEKQRLGESGTGIKRESTADDGTSTPASETRKEYDDEGEADSLVTSSSALGTYDDDEDEEDDELAETPGLDEEIDQLLGVGTSAERAYRSQMAARARTRLERAASGADYDDSEDTEREEAAVVTTPGRRAGGDRSSAAASQQQQQSQVQQQQQQAAASSSSSVTLGQGVTSERRVLGRLDEETEEETDQTATTTNTSRRAAAVSTSASGRPTSAAPVGRSTVAAGLGASPDLGFGTEEEDEDDDERRAQRTQARWDVWREAQRSQEQQQQQYAAVTPTAATTSRSAQVLSQSSGAAAGRSVDDEGSETSPSASWESVGDEAEAEEEEDAEERAARLERRAAAEAASRAEARRLKELGDNAMDSSADADDEGGEAALSPVVGPSAVPGPSRIPLSGAVAGPSSGAVADDEASTATEEEGEEGAKTAG